MAFAPGLTLYLWSSRFQVRKARRKARALAALHDLPEAALAQLLGRSGRARPDGPLVWFNASTGSRLPALEQLVDRFLELEPQAHVLLTAAAGSGLRDRPSSAVISELRPIDNVAIVNAFLDHWRPDVAVFSGSELGPALIELTARRGIPMIMLDAHLPEGDSAQNWHLAPLAARVLLGRFRHILTGSQKDADRLISAGASDWKVEVPGFLEEGTAALPCNEQERDALARTFAGRPVWLAARITEFELPMVIAAHRQALRISHRLLLILVPGNQSDAAAMRETLEDEGWITGSREDGDEPEEQVQVYVAETQNELGLWYRLAPITYVGNSMLYPGGGHDPYEPAALGSAVIHGPFVSRHEAVFSRMNAVEAATEVNSGEALGAAVATLLAPDKAAQMAHRAWQLTSAGAEVSERAVELICAALETPEAQR